ncbi:MAG: glycosyltransferase family 2 protein, partial [Clostridia bacterium]|nr:glycosyltransferase family 2 protein [Clostridia bacterium]
RQIDLRDNKYISVENTPLQCTPNHFQSEYYRTELNEFNKIVLSDMLRKKEDKFLSIVVPCYNAANTISRCVESILRQSDSFEEIICVDDGSTDDTVKELLSFGDRVVIIKKDHEGVAAARNVGLRRATGEWIWFVDADDEIMPGAVDAVRATVKDENDAICFGAKVINNPRAEYRLDDIVLPDKEINKDIFRFMVREYNKPFVWNCIYKKDFLKKNDIIFPEGQEIGEDMCFSMKVFATAESVRLCSEPVYVYHYLEENGAMQKALGTKERAVQHVKMVENVLRESTAKGRDRDALNEWAFQAIDPECFLYAETVRLLCPVWKKYRVKASGLSLRKKLKCRLLRSKILCELYILLKRRK